MSFPPIFIPAASGIAMGVAPDVLDEIGSSPTAAYSSARRLRSAYSGSLIRVRRSSDNTEQDIGVSAGRLDQSSLVSFCGANDGFVVTWYDQSGNGYNVTNSTAGQQPKIVSSGTVITSIDGNPCLEFDGSDDRLVGSTAVSNIITDSAFTAMFGLRPDVGEDGGNYYLLDNFLSFTSGALHALPRTESGSPTFRVYEAITSPPFEVSTSAAASAFPSNAVVGIRHGGGTLTLAVNGGTEGSVSNATLSATTGNVCLGASFNASGFFDGRMAEAVFYNSKLSSSDYNTIGAAFAETTATTWTTVS